jgi:Uma2 family endonuclease
MTSIPHERDYTYADLLEWDDDVRYELYSGHPVALASPSDVHQRIFTALLLQIGNYLEGKRCTVYPAPFDVRLFEENGERPEDVDTVVQPDLMVVCDPNKVDRRGVHGAPDLVIEILSDSTRRNDRLVKYSLYQRAGVWEYWIVDPVSRVVSVYTLEEGAYHAAATYAADAQVPVGLWEDFSVDLTKVFPET